MPTRRGSRRTTPRPTTRVGKDRGPNAGVARGTSGVAAAKATVATSQAEAEAPRASLPLLHAQGAGVGRRAATAASAVGTPTRETRAAGGPFLDGAEEAEGVASATPVPLVRPARALEAKGT